MRARLMCLLAILAQSAFGNPIYDIVDVSPPGTSYAWAAGMNASGQIVGSYRTDEEEWGVFLYTPGIGTTILETPGSNAQAGGINDIGQIVGNFHATDGLRVFLYTPGSGTSVLTDFLPDYAVPLGINNAGQIIGYILDALPEGNRWAFVYTADAGIVVLPTFGGFVWSGAASLALSINNAGQIVGSAVTETFSEHAFLYTPGVGTIDLGTSGGSL